MSRERGENLLWEDAKALVRDQESVIKCVHKPDAWANFPRRTRGESPEDYDKRTVGYKKASELIFAARVVDRLSMLFGDGEYGDDVGARVRRISDRLAQEPLSHDPRRGRGDRLLRTRIGYQGNKIARRRQAPGQSRSIVC
jgi:hypothetical protein